MDLTKWSQWALMLLSTIHVHVDEITILWKFGQNPYNLWRENGGLVERFSLNIFTGYRFFFFYLFYPFGNTYSTLSASYNPVFALLTHHGQNLDNKNYKIIFKLIWMEGRSKSSWYHQFLDRPPFVIWLFLCLIFFCYQV